MNSVSSSNFGPLRHEPASDLYFRHRPAVAPVASKRVVLLHGVGGNEDNLEGLAAHISPSIEVLLVRGPLTLGQGQYAWFQVQFGPNGPVIDAAQAEHSRERLIRLIEALPTHGDVPAKTVIAGFSQGGIMSASVGLSAPHIVAGFAILSGRILPELTPRIADREARRHLSAFIAHGQFDNKLPVTWAHSADTQLNELDVAHETKLYPMGHELTMSVVTDFTNWLVRPLAL